LYYEKTLLITIIGWRRTWKGVFYACEGVSTKIKGKEESGAW